MLELHPAHLLVGTKDEVFNYLNNALKKIFCKSCYINSNLNNNSPNFSACKICKKIDNQRHESIIFIEPEGQYTICQLDLIFNAISFKLEQNTHFFFIINKAELLNVTCSNKLLKSLEEPPAGYHFILIANRVDYILDTIASRCIIKIFSKSQDNAIDNSEQDLLFKIFINIELLKFDIESIKEIERTKIANYLVPNLIDQLYNYFADHLKKAMLDKNISKISYLIKVIELLDFSKKYYPMPGSSKIFLKNLYLQILNIFLN